MRILTRHNVYEELSLDKILARHKTLGNGLNVDFDQIAVNTVRMLSENISTYEIDNISAEIAHETLDHPDYQTFAARIVIDSLHKRTDPSFVNTMITYNEATERIHASTMIFIIKNAKQIDAMIDSQRDYTFGYNSFMMLRDKQYLLRLDDGKVVERPQYLIMRVAIATSGFEYVTNEEALKEIQEAYELMSLGFYTHATPTMQNACLKKQQLASCFLLSTEDDAIEIMRTLTNTAIISKNSGGVGISFSDVRSAGSIINSTGGKSKGLANQLAMYNAVVNCWSQKGRNGSCSTFLEEWHGDFPQWLNLRSKSKDNKVNAADLFYSIWMNDLFIERLREGKSYTLFTPSTAPGLNEVYDGMEVCKRTGWCHNKGYRKVFGQYMKGTLYHSPVCEGDQPDCEFEFEPVKAFTKLYTYYENEGKGVGTVDTKKIAEDIARMRRETGGPFICFKDSVNRASMQNGLGTIKGSNLCVEIMQYADNDNYASCILGNIALPKFIHNGKFDHEKLVHVTRILTKRLDNLIDVNVYPVKECERFAYDYRSLGIGIQGLANVFLELNIAFDSREAEQLDYVIRTCSNSRTIQRLAKESIRKRIITAPIMVTKPKASW
jgi:ribonucleoside-diphosphate reductase alpha chain